MTNPNLFDSYEQNEEDDNLSEYHSMSTPEEPEPAQFHCEVKQETDPKYLIDCITIHFIALRRITYEGNQRGGAILLELTNVESGEMQEKWIPKVLCKNLDAKNKTVTIWNGSGFVDKELEEYLA